MKSTLRVVTYNVHKGVRGLGPRRRLEIHNLGYAIAQFGADLICLQEVRARHHHDARRFEHWPARPQADFLAPRGYHAIYRSNAYTRHGEHGNALLSRWPVVAVQHEDMSDHRFEQRGLLHVLLDADGHPLHVVVLHLGLLAGGRRRQIAQLDQYLRLAVPKDQRLIVAGDLNDWATQLHPALTAMQLIAWQAGHHPTFPSRLPLVQLDYIYTRGLHPLKVRVPRGPSWWRMSDHLPLIADFGW